MTQVIEIPAFAEVAEVSRMFLLRNLRIGLRKSVTGHPIDLSVFAEVAEVPRKSLLRNLRKAAEVGGSSAEVDSRNLRDRGAEIMPTPWKQTILPVAEVACGSPRRSSDNPLILLAEVGGSSSPPIVPPTYLRGSRPADAVDIRCGGDVDALAADLRRTCELRREHPSDQRLAEHEARLRRALRAMGVRLRELGLSPRQLGTNPRSLRAARRAGSGGGP
jgi:hypothetical protein